MSLSFSLYIYRSVSKLQINKLYCLSGCEHLNLIIHSVDIKKSIMIHNENRLKACFSPLNWPNASTPLSVVFSIYIYLLIIYLYPIKSTEKNHPSNPVTSPRDALAPWQVPPGSAARCRASPPERASEAPPGLSLGDPNGHFVAISCHFGKGFLGGTQVPTRLPVLLRSM